MGEPRCVHVCNFTEDEHRTYTAYDRDHEFARQPAPSEGLPQRATGIRSPYSLKPAPSEEHLCDETCPG